MSVFRTMSTKINDESCLKKGLTALGYKPVATGKTESVRGHGSEKFQADVILRMEDTGKKGDIGFAKQKDGSYSLVYDTWLFKLDNEKFIQEVSQQHAKAKIQKIALQQGLELCETTNANGTMKMKYIKVN